MPDVPVRRLAIAFLFVLAVTLPPYLLATFRPPAGMSFIGTFHYGDDFYNYLSYAQQAEDGAFLFRNKVMLADHPPALINLEWWLVGTLSRLLGGGKLVVSYRIFGVLAALGFLAVADRWLGRLGLGPSHRLPALLLLATGGGLGGVLLTFAGRDVKACLDLYAGLFPFVGLLTNPHFVAGTTLLLVSLLLFEDARTNAGRLAAVAAATALALVRPYDVMLLVLIRTAAVVVLEPPRRWVPALFPLAGLLPVVLYLYWLFYRSPGFASYPTTRYLFPQLADLTWALLPAVLLALTGLFRPCPDPPARRARTQLLAWVALTLLVAILQPVQFSLQFLVGIGVPLLCLGAFGLGRRPPLATILAAGLLCTSLVALLRFVSQPRTLWFVPRGDMEIARALRPTCRRGDVLFAPPSVGIFAYGLTPCRAFVSHRVDPDYPAKLAELERFGARAPAERAAFLDAYRITHLLLPGDAGPRPVAWLGEGTAFVRRIVVSDGPVWSLYLREGPRSP